MLIPGLDGRRVRTGQRRIDFTAIPGVTGMVAPDSGAAASWLAIAAGTYSQPADFTTGRGVGRVTAANVAGSRATITGPSLKFSSFTAILFMLEGMTTTAVAADELELSIATNLNGAGNFLGGRYLEAASATPKAVSGKNAGGSVSEDVSSIDTFKGVQAVNLGIGLFPRSNEWAIIGGDIDAPGTWWVSGTTTPLTGWDWNAQTTGLVVPQLSVKAAGTTQPSISLGTVRLVLESN